jgi:hypothetical protein
METDSQSASIQGSCIQIIRMEYEHEHEASVHWIGYVAGHLQP